MNKNTFLIGVAFAVIGILLIAIFAAGYLSIDFAPRLLIVAFFGFIVWQALSGNLIKELMQKYKEVIIPVLSTVILNLMIIVLFVITDRQVFGDFVSDYGLRGSWGLFTLNMKANINGSVQTLPYLNSNFLFLLLCVAVNIFTTATYLTRNYRDREKSSQQNRQSPPSSNTLQKSS